MLNERASWPPRFYRTTRGADLDAVPRRRIEEVRGVRASRFLGGQLWAAVRANQVAMPVPFRLAGLCRGKSFLKMSRCGSAIRVQGGSHGTASRPDRRHILEWIRELVAVDQASRGGRALSGYYGCTQSQAGRGGHRGTPLPRLWALDYSAPAAPDGRWANGGRRGARDVPRGGKSPPASCRASLTGGE